MSHDNYLAIRRFIVRHIQDQNFSENDGLPGRVLVRLCLEQFTPNLQDPEAIRTEKKSIEGAIRHMVENSMLQPVKKNQGFFFRLDPYFNIKDKMNPSASQPSEDPQSTQKALEALEKEASPDIEDLDMGQHVDDELDQQLTQQLDESMIQIEDEVAEGLDMQGERPQDGKQKVVQTLAERQQEHRSEELIDNRGGKEQQDQADDQITNPTQAYQDNQVMEVADVEARRQQEILEAARIEAISEDAPDWLWDLELISSLIQHMHKIMPKRNARQPIHSKHILKQRRMMKAPLEHQAGSAGRCWRLPIVIPQASLIFSVQENIRIRPRGGEWTE
jgi:MCM6 C-terminal winged-helix domain